MARYLNTDLLSLRHPLQKSDKKGQDVDATKQIPSAKKKNKHTSNFF
jgi:hypothetical protein